MVETGDWSTADLIQYLVEVQNDLSQNEITRLKAMPAFPKEQLAISDNSSSSPSGKTFERYKAERLYEPQDILRNLGLPILDWGTQKTWNPGSREGVKPYSCDCL